jgi:hypothetical protein
MREIIWTTFDRWDYETYSSQARLRVMAGQLEVVEALSKQCREKFGKEPDLKPQKDDMVFFRDSGLRKRRR